TPMLTGSDTEWFPTLGESWQVPHVPGIVARFKSSFKPPTAVMLIGFELNNTSPRAMLARAVETKSECDGLSHALKRLKIVGVKAVPFGFPPRGSLIPT